MYSNSLLRFEAQIDHGKTIVGVQWILKNAVTFTNFILKELDRKTTYFESKYMKDIDD
jgi:hypothetical protein